MIGQGTFGAPPISASMSDTRFTTTPRTLVIHGERGSIADTQSLNRSVPGWWLPVRLLLIGVVMTENVSVSSWVAPVGQRRFSKEEKVRIVAEYQAAASSTERGMVLRRWGTYQQNISRWNKELSMPSSQPGSPSRGRGQKSVQRKLEHELTVAEKKLAASQARVALLEELVAAQGKALGLHVKDTGVPRRFQG